MSKTFKLSQQEKEAIVIVLKLALRYLVNRWSLGITSIILTTFIGAINV